MYGYIYKTTNKINGKIYIGKKRGEFTESYKGSGKYLKNAINKYGLDNFSVEVIDYCNNLEEQNEKERYWIKYYRDLNVSMYNIANGGDGGDLVTCLPENEYKKFCELMSNLNKAGITGNKGKHLSEEHRKHIGEANKGKIHSEEWRRKHGDAIRGKTAWNKGLTKDDPRVAKYARVPGSFKHTEETKKRISERTKGIKKPNVSKNMRGRKWMHNSDSTIMVFEKDMPKYRELGFIDGRGSIK